MVKAYVSDSYLVQHVKASWMLHHMNDLDIICDIRDESWVIFGNNEGVDIWKYHQYSCGYIDAMEVGSISNC